jgi:probable rRNA maturation factor
LTEIITKTTTKFNIELNVEMSPAIADLTSISDLDWQNWFQIWLNVLTSKVELTSSDYEAALMLTGDREIQDLNLKYRHQNCPTDVLAFAALEAEIPMVGTADDLGDDLDLDWEDLNAEDRYSEPVYLGDIVVSVPTAMVQASEQGHSINYELVWLAAHGLLHLLGWDHPSDRCLEEMLAEQEFLIQAVRLDKKLFR